jgi:hypothetical protein
MDLDDCEPDPGETVRADVTLPEDFAAELIDAYPGAVSLPEAIRMSVQADLSRQREKATPAKIQDSVVAALQESGGSWGTTETLRIGVVEHVDIDEAAEVSVTDADADE